MGRRLNTKLPNTEAVSKIDSCNKAIQNYETAKIDTLKRISGDSFDTKELIAQVRENISNEVAETLEKLEHGFGWLFYSMLDNLLFKNPFNLPNKLFGFEMEDVSKYYLDKQYREQVMETLREDILRHQGKEIFLIAHSMGSIITYDVLREMGRDQTISSPIDIKHLVTLGSPLGFTFIKSKILSIHRGELRTPSCISKDWKNFSDPRDSVCFDTNLSNDYGENRNSIRVEDHLVASDLKDDPHNIFGYLRTPEFIQHLYTFLQGQEIN